MLLTDAVAMRDDSKTKNHQKPSVKSEVKDKKMEEKKKGEAIRAAALEGLKRKSEGTC